MPFYAITMTREKDCPASLAVRNFSVHGGRGILRTEELVRMPGISSYCAFWSCLRDKLFISFSVVSGFWKTATKLLHRGFERVSNCKYRISKRTWRILGSVFRERIGVFFFVSISREIKTVCFAYPRRFFCIFVPVAGKNRNSDAFLRWV